nr:hypothetical protein [Tanacetum cinerariifolium]
HVEALVVEVAHHLFEVAFMHLAVTDTDPRFGHQLSEVGGTLLDRLHIVVQRLELFFLTDTEAVFFVDDHQPQVLDLDVVLQQLVGADDDVDLALGEIGHGSVDFFGRLESAHDFNGHRPVSETVAEAVVVLLREQGGRYQDRDLLAA